MTTEVAPLSQIYSILNSQAVVNPQPTALIESIENFSNNTGQFSITSFHGTDPHATLTFVGGQGSLTTASANNSTFCIDTNMPLTIPQNFVSIDVASVVPAGGVTFFTVEPGIFKDGNNAVSFELGLDSSRNITGGNIQQIIAGTKANLGTVGTSAGPVTSIGFGMVTQATGITEYSGWVKKSGGPWQLLLSTSSSTYNFATIGNLAGWFGGFSLWCNVGYTAVVDNLVFGRFGSVAMRDEEVVIHQDGTPYNPSGNLVMFTASANDPAGLQYSGLFTFDLVTFDCEQVGVIWVERGGVYANDLNMCIVLMNDGTARVTSVTWGNFISGTFDLHVNLSTLPDQSIVANPLTILVSPTPLSLPGLLTGTYGAYDGYLVFNSATNTWQLAYSITQQTSFAGSPFYAAFATSPDLVTWTLVGADTAHLGYEGTRQYEVNGAWYIMAGGPAGASTTARVYDSTMTFIGLLDATFHGGTQTQPHPMAFPFGDFFYLITFDNTTYSGGGNPFGNLILQQAPRFVSVTVPDVVGLTDADAQAAIIAGFLTVGAITSVSDPSPPGTVISQSPVAGTSVSAGSAVALTESLGSGDTTVPNLVNTSVTVIAPGLLAAESLILGTVTFAFSGTVIAGNIISQSPAAGSSVAIGSAVNVVVSSGLPPLTVPDLFGLTQANAINLLLSLGLVPGAIGSAPSKFVPPGEVQAQNPNAGIAVAVGTIVSFVLSQGTPVAGTLFDFEATVISQYANSPTILQLCNNLNQYIDQSANFANFFNFVWNVDTAVGFGLDIWGKIVGVSRLLQIPNTTAYVGFYQSSESQPAQDWTPAGSDQPPYNNPPVGGAFYTGHNATTAYLLPDDSYRQLILAKAFANIASTTAPAINQILQNLYGPGSAWVLNTGPMAISYNLSFTPTAIQLAILEQSGVIPTPPGVSVVINTNV